MTDLFKDKFTIINQIPQSAINPEKIKWKKHILTKCNKQNGVFNAATGTMSYDNDKWTVQCKNVDKYKPANWIDGYYALSDDEKDNYFTVAVDDLLIFAEIPEPTPENFEDFKKIESKYSELGGLITGVQAYIHYDEKGKPWVTNHIEITKE